MSGASKRVGTRAGASRAGVAYLVLGRHRGGTVDLRHLGPAGYRIIAPAGTAVLSFSGVGDVNHDGLADVVVAARNPDAQQVATAYVVFGSHSGRDVHLGDMGRRSFQIHNLDVRDGGLAVAPAGDANGDGVPDILLGVDAAGGMGAAYVVFGKRGTGAVDVSDLGSDGFSVVGGYVGSNASAAGDVNGDHRADVVLGRLSRSS